MLKEVSAERDRQLQKWGPQSHPDGTSLEEYGGIAEIMKAECDAAADSGALTWIDILQEEVYEAASEEDDKKLETELIQVAAVAVAWVEDIRAKRAAKKDVSG